MANVSIGPGLERRTHRRHRQWLETCVVRPASRQHRSRRCCVSASAAARARWRSCRPAGSGGVEWCVVWVKHFDFKSMPLWCSSISPLAWRRRRPRRPRRADRGGVVRDGRRRCHYMMSPRSARLGRRGRRRPQASGETDERRGDVNLKSKCFTPTTHHTPTLGHKCSQPTTVTHSARPLLPRLLCRCLILPLLAVRSAACPRSVPRLRRDGRLALERRGSRRTRVVARTSSRQFPFFLNAGFRAF